jgi:hypothetical protein
MIRTMAIACAIVALGLTPAGMAAAQDLDEDSDIEQPAESGSEAWSDVGAKTLDAVVVRPVSALSTVVGFGMFLVSTPFVAPSQGITDSWEVFVRTPFDNTFQRTLGDL